MVSDNNNINNLASASDDETTTELEALADTFRPDPDHDEELEADASTFEFEDLSDAPATDDDESIRVLRADLMSRTESVNRLQYDIEQLRIRWTGLEKEIKAREQLTDNVNEELRRARRKLARTRKALRRREEENRELADALEGKSAELEQASVQIERLREAAREAEGSGNALQAQIDEQQQTITRLQEQLKLDEADQARREQRALSRVSEVQTLQGQLAAARLSVAELRQYLDGRKRDWDRQQQALLDNEETIAGQEREIERLQQELARQVGQLADEKAASEKLAGDLEEREEDLRRLRRDNRELRQTLQNDTARQVERSRRQLDRQAGRLTANEHEIDGLREQLRRSERYADDLRYKLRKQTTIASDAVIAQEQLQMSLDEALERIADLGEKLANGQRSVEELEQERERLKTDFEQQVRQIRFELDAAQDTISDHESINEQLASDLIDNQGFRQALEQQLSATEKDNKKAIRDLERKLRRLEERDAELSEKLGNKDAAIAALLSELATRSRTIERLGEMETVIHEIDGRMSERVDEESGNSERTARMLIGWVDGQELRFPLFKDRLTVGRSSHNDIQLNAQYVSRRHAVIVTESDGTKIVDWGSKNGVFVNEMRVAEQRLQHGDIVTIGMADFKYEERSKR